MKDQPLVIFRDLLNDTRFCKRGTEIVLNHRNEANEPWNTVRGHYMDDHILRYMDCNLLAVKYEVGAPLLVAVEGKPHEWGV